MDHRCGRTRNSGKKLTYGLDRSLADDILQTAAVLHHTFILLALNQEYQTMIHNEIESVVKGRGDADMDYDDYPRLRYTIAAIVCLSSSIGHR